MAKQLIYSAVDEGIDGGRSSLCYAAASEGALLNRLVLQNILPINSYQQLYKYPATGPDPNPVNYCHYRLPAGPTEISVLSRICAHHYMVEDRISLPIILSWMVMNKNPRDLPKS